MFEINYELSEEIVISSSPLNPDETTEKNEETKKEETKEEEKKEEVKKVEGKKDELKSEATKVEPGTNEGDRKNTGTALVYLADHGNCFVHYCCFSCSTSMLSTKQDASSTHGTHSKLAS
eukprot:TRINITY_DN6698_c0_g1_i2.p1 TRINITY_DN6698_c0_g1~~TRINITY_DN6698_c0_g1_i2.p1  ORF type:complete len:120 (-),score=25.64 TRINITY_DN6698_c0_g1_i2:81-440(-)